MSLDRVSLNTLQGPVICRLRPGARQHVLLMDPEWEIGGTDRVWRDGVYCPHITQSRKAPPEAELDGGALGLGLGIVYLATDSVGERFTGSIVRIIGKRYHLRRQRLQKCGTRNAKRRIRRTRWREARFQKDINHCISKRLVQKTAVSCKALALEDLSRIHERATVRHEHRYERRS
jgi:transposase